MTTDDTRRPLGSRVSRAHLRQTMRGAVAREVSGIVDRDGWMPGPWDGEPDRLEWVDEQTGFPCLIIRNPFAGSLCGYVAVPPRNPFHGLERTAPALRGIDVHDNITYAAPCMDVNDIPDDAQETPGFHPALLVCHVPEPGQPEDVWWLGFAASRFDDLQPGTHAQLVAACGRDLADRSTHGLFRMRYRDLSYMRGECTRLAAQLWEWSM